MYSPDGLRIATASSDGTVRLWSETGECILVLRTVTLVSSVAFSPDGSRLACGYDDGQVRVWESVRLN